MQPLDIPGHANELPFAFGCLVAAHLETPESHDRLNNAEYRLRRDFAQGVDDLASRRLEPMSHPGHHIGIFRQGRRLSKSVPGRLIVLLPIHRDIWCYPLFFAGVDVRLAEIAAVGNQHTDGAEFLGQGRQVFQSWLYLLFVIGLLSNLSRNDQFGCRVQARLGIVALRNPAGRTIIQESSWIRLPDALRITNLQWMVKGKMAFSTHIQ